jgi:hypothetical protein
VTKKFLVREKERADQAGSPTTAGSRTSASRAGSPSAPQRPWVKLPHAPIDSGQAHRSPEAARFGRRKRPGVTDCGQARGRRAASRPARVSVSVSKRVPEMRIHLAPRSHAYVGADASALGTSRWRFPRDIIRTSRCRSGLPLPLGHRSRAECSIWSSPSAPGVDLVERLNSVLPDGLRVWLSTHPVQDPLDHEPARRRQLSRALPRPHAREAGLDPEASTAMLARGGADLLGREHLLVRRKNEEQAREFDARPSIVHSRPAPRTPCPVLDAHIRFIPRAMVRPEELVASDPSDRGRPRARCRAHGAVDGGREHRLDPLALLSVRTPGVGPERGAGRHREQIDHHQR